MKTGISHRCIPRAQPRAAANCALCDTRLAPDREFSVGTAGSRIGVRCCQECAGLFVVFLDALLETARITPVPSHNDVPANVDPFSHEYFR